ncbi:hypothetical protein [Christiangramia aquimixticola]|uniref:hypothetical protein n=1 Tax=Christiangramia aquimixticola TaxID=1697558 RepID=UPI003AA7B693
MKKFLLLCFISTLLISCKDGSSEDQNIPKESTNKIEDKIALANGFKEFENIKNLKFTFNVKVNDTLRTSRKWAWNVENNQISLTEKDSTMTYTKGDSIPEENKYIDQRFVNDSYWLLFPFQLKWSNANISEVTSAKAPISGTEMQKLTASYPSQGGYTPGDSYDVYFDKDHIIKEWVYKSSQGGRELATTWEDYQNHKGIKIANMHKSADGTFQLFFTEVAAE